MWRTRCSVLFRKRRRTQGRAVGGDASVKDLEKINGITYLFDENGNPVYGLRNLNNGSDFETYYFGDRQTSSVQKGKMTIEEGDGTKSEFYFTESGGKAGRGFTGVKNKYLFYKGKLQEADDGTKYEVICVEGRNYLVNPSGKVMKIRQSRIPAAPGSKPIKRALW